MNAVDLTAGTIEYGDTGGAGPVIVFVHGLLMDGTLWDQVVAELRVNHRCLTPTLPLGAHRRPVQPAAELSLAAIADLLGEFLDRLELIDVTLVGNDTGGALVQLLATRGQPRVARIVLASCEAFDNYPPGLTGRSLALAGRLSPPLFGLFLQQLRWRPLRRLPIAFGWLTRRGDAVTAGWLTPVLTRPGIRRDTVRLLRAARTDGRRLAAAAERLPEVGVPALVIWAAEDRVMPPEHGRRLAELLPDARLVEIGDSYTLLPLDQPGEFARAVGEFATAGTRAAPPR